MKYELSQEDVDNCCTSIVDVLRHFEIDGSQDGEWESLIITLQRLGRHDVAEYYEELLRERREFREDNGLFVNLLIR